MPGDAGAPASVRRLVLGYDGLAIGVTTHRRADAEWLVEVLLPGFDRLDPGPADVEVELRIDPEGFERLERRGPSGGFVVGAVLDDSDERFERWTSARGGEADFAGGAAADMQTAFDPAFGVFHEVVPGRLVRVTASSGELCRVALMRAVRELATEYVVRRGGLFLHAAAFSVDGRAVVIAGEKGAGKTTSLSFSLQLLPEARFIANDRVRVAGTAAGFDVRAMPTVMSFRPAGLALLPELEAAVRRQRGMPYHGRREARERPDLGPIVPFGDGRFGLSPGLYPELLGRASAASAVAAAIVFPEVAHHGGGLRVSSLPPGEASGRLARTLLGARDLERRSELFGLPGAGPLPGEAELRRRAEAVARSVPCHVWEVGSGAPHDEKTLRSFLRRQLG